MSQEFVERNVQHRAAWRRMLSLVLVVVGVGGMVLPVLELDPVVSAAVALGGIVVFLPVEYAKVSFSARQKRVAVRFHGRYGEAPIDGATAVVYIVSEAEDEIRLQYADDSHRTLWAGTRIQGIAEAVSDLTGLEVQVEVL